MWNDLIAAVGPPFIALVSLAVVALVGMAEQYVRKNWLNNVAQSAFANAAGGIVNKMGEDILKSVITPEHAEVIQGVQKVQARIPDTIKALGLTPAGIAERIIDHLGRLGAPAIGALVPTTKPEIGSKL